jgi:hypothetical protein
MESSFLDNANWEARLLETSVMSFEDEKKMMGELSKKAKEGKLLVAKHIKEIAEKKIGKEVSDDYIEDLFKRYNWKKKISRPEHSKKEKKKHKKHLKKLSEILATERRKGNDTRPLILFF